MLEDGCSWVDLIVLFGHYNIQQQWFQSNLG